MLRAACLRGCCFSCLSRLALLLEQAAHGPHLLSHWVINRFKGSTSVRACHRVEASVTAAAVGEVVAAAVEGPDPSLVSRPRMSNLAAVCKPAADPAAGLRCGQTSQQRLEHTALLGRSSVMLFFLV